MICVVLRSFPGPGSIPLQAGTEVDVSEWIHADRLISQRYLRVKSLNKKKTDDSVASAAAESKKGLTAKPAKVRRVV